MPTIDPLKDLQGVRVAIVHEWLTAYAGSEKVVEQILQMFPRADIFAIVDHLPTSQRAFLNGRKVHTSFIQKLPASKRLFRKLLWLLPLAVENFDLSNYDVIISSSHAVAKGVITGPDQVHICYCHSPIRYAWDLQHEYLRHSGLERGIGSLYARAVLHYLRLWDVRTSNGVDHFVANSSYIARRISKAYGRSSSVVHPPVDVDAFALCPNKSDFYLSAARLVPYKRMSLIISAFAKMPHRKLVVVGHGPNFARLQSSAPPNVQVLGYQSAEKLRELMGQAKAFVFAAEEDFGITVVEAQACGTPVIAYGRGGVLDSVIPGKTGFFFERQTEDSIIACVEKFEAEAHDLASAYAIRDHSLKFSAAEFKRKFGNIVVHEWASLDNLYAHAASS